MEACGEEGNTRAYGIGGGRLQWKSVDFGKKEHDTPMRHERPA